jgi:hypothetical protein
MKIFWSVKVTNENVRDILGIKKVSTILKTSRYVYETFLRYVLRYVRRYNFGKKQETSYDEVRSRPGMCLYDIYRISKL